jgi:tetratricopeptide (TPR) repeat protein
LLPQTPGCPVLVTSRCNLTDLDPVTHLAVDVFTADEALEFLTRAAPRVSVGDDPDAAARITARCGNLPLALGLLAGHMRAKPGWTLTDHADWLDERHHQRRLDAGVELALDLSYQHLPSGRRRLLRLLALHPGQDFDAYAAAALADTDLDTAKAHVHHLCGDHLLQKGTPGRYTFHDLIRAYATTRAHDEDRPPVRRAALTRLFDHYLATTATAMNTLYPADAHRRPRIAPAATPAPDLTDPDTAVAWLDTDRPTLVAVAAHTAVHGWPSHTTRLSGTLFRYLDGGHHTDALTVHGHAHHAARHTGDPTGQAQALTNLGLVHWRLGRYGSAAEHFQQTLDLFRLAGDPVGQARALGNLGIVETTQGRYRTATGHHEQALTLYRQAGDRTGEATTLTNLGVVEVRLGRYQSAADHHQQALTLCRQLGDRSGEADTLNNLGYAEVRLGRYGPSAEHLQQALTLYRQLGNRNGEAHTLDSLGTLHTRFGQPTQATGHYQRALAIFREIGAQDGEARALNGLGEAAQAAGHPTKALIHHTAAHTVAADTGQRDQQARAHTGLAHAHHTLNHPTPARHHYQHALTLYTDLGMPDADRIRTHLAAIDNTHPEQQ